VAGQTQLAMISDDQIIKVEIEDISRRIDHIIKTVNRSIPAQDSSESLEASGNIVREDRISQKQEQSTQKAE
jgi:hypothetical protein